MRIIGKMVQITTFIGGMASCSLLANEPIDPVKQAVDALQASVQQAAANCALLGQELCALRQAEEQKLRETEAICQQRQRDVDAACQQKQREFDVSFEQTCKRRQQEFDECFGRECREKSRDWNVHFEQECEERRGQVESDMRELNRNYRDLYPRIEYQTFDRFRSQESFKFYLSKYFRDQLGRDPQAALMALKVTLLDETNGVVTLKFELNGRDFLNSPLSFSVNWWGNFDSHVLDPVVTAIRSSYARPPSPGWGGGGHYPPPPAPPPPGGGWRHPGFPGK